MIFESVFYDYGLMNLIIHLQTFFKQNNYILLKQYIYNYIKKGVEKLKMKKIIILSLICLFALGILCGAASASHTFKKGGYKMKVTDKQYKKLKKSKAIYGKYIQKKVGTKKKAKYTYKTVKTETFRSYYDKEGWYKGCKVITHHNGYWSNSKAKWVGCSYKTVTHYNSDGSYYEDEIEYDKWRFTSYKKVGIWMLAGKDARYGDSKIHVSLYDFKKKKKNTNL